MENNCSNCIHRQVCFRTPSTLLCGHYRDEATMIESPVALGSTVYVRIAYKNSDIVHVNPCTVTGLHLRDTDGPNYNCTKREEYMILRPNPPASGFSKHVPFSKIGKEVFFTEQDARMYGKEDEYV